MLTTTQFLEALSRVRTTEVVVTTMGSVRPWGRISQSDLDFASADSAMGHAADFALGIAMAQPARKVICLNGDGSMLMTLGTLVTIIESHVRNLILFVIQNGTYEITGNQSVPGAGRIDFPAMARAAGFERVYQCQDVGDLETTLTEIVSGSEPVFAAVQVEPGREGPIVRRASEPADYLKVPLEESAWRLRAALLES